MPWLLEQVAYPDDRKLRLLACRFIREIAVDTTRTVWDLLTDERSRSAVVAAEQYAEGRATDAELEVAERAASSAAWAARAAARAAATSATSATSAAWAAAWAAASLARDAARAAASAATSAATSAARVSALAQQAGIIRDMIPVEEIAPLFERYIEARKKQLQNNHND
jgi:cobalamin biosynthesis Mg chelatase CobN